MLRCSASPITRALRGVMQQTKTLHRVSDHGGWGGDKVVALFEAAGVFKLFFLGGAIILLNHPPPPKDDFQKGSLGRWLAFYQHRLAFD